MTGGPLTEAGSMSHCLGFDYAVLIYTTCLIFSFLFSTQNTLAEMSREVKPVRPWESGMQFSQEVWYTPPANQPAFYNQYHVSGYMQPFRPSAASFQPIVHPSFRPIPSQVNSVNSVDEQRFESVRHQGFLWVSVQTSPTLPPPMR